MTGLEKLVDLQAQINQNVIANATYTAANEAFGVFMVRIFQNGEDSNNTKIGPYKSKSWKEIREHGILPKGTPRKDANGKIFKGEHNGRQVEYVDFNHTGSLFGALNLDKIEDNHYQINGIEDETIKIRGHEKRFSKDILKPSQKEEDVFEEELKAIIKQRLGL